MKRKTLKETIAQVWKDKRLIFQGIRYKLFKNDLVEEVYLERRAACSTCPFRTYKSSECMVPGTQPCCSKCGCSLSLKLRSLSSECPVGKWDAYFTEEQEVKYNIQKNGR
jgi:hypothetical protein